MKRTAVGRQPLLPVWLLAAVALSSVRVLPAQEAQVGLPRGAVVAPFVVQDLDGNDVALDSVIGRRPVLIQFWAGWCSNCAALEPRLRRAQSTHGSRAEFLVVAVGVNQTRNSVRRRLAQHPLPGRVLWDGNGAAVRALQAPATGYVVVLDARGRVTYTGMGADQDIEAAVEGVVR